MHIQNKSKLRQKLLALFLSLSLLVTIFAPVTSFFAEDNSPPSASQVAKPDQPQAAESRTLPATDKQLPATDNQLPRTGDTQNLLYLMLGVLLVAVASFLSWLKLGQLFAKARD